MMKNTIGILLFTLLLAIAACQQQDTTDASGSAGATDTPHDASAIATEKDAETKPAKPPRNFARLGAARGLLAKTAAATPGYVYFSPLISATTYLINTDGQVVHTWESAYGPSGWLYLKSNGNLVRGGRDPEAPIFAGGGQGGWLQEFTWDGDLVWEYRLASTEHLAHHDVAIMPNGNILTIAWEAKSVDAVIAAGRNPETTPKAGLWPDTVIELQPKGKNDAEIVWEWHIWDHLIQDFDASKSGFGDVADHPELMDVNRGEEIEPITQEGLDKKMAAGFASSNDSVDNNGSDIYHVNAINYNAALDQIVISSPHLNEIYVIDHSTTTEQAAGHTGGRRGKGGDFLYRWGNPSNYGHGDESLQKLGGQHDVKWIPPGYPGAGNILVFNNKVPGSKPGFSTVFELKTPLTDTGYETDGDGRYGPAEPVWSYVPEDPFSLFSPFISGAHRLTNGNTLITEGAAGRFIEVDTDGNVLWEYMTPYAGYLKNPDGTSPQPVGPFVYATFRATHIPVDHPALVGKDLTPIEPQPDAYKPPE